MEILPVLDRLDKPEEGIWYSLRTRGRAPGVSVGHTCMFIPSEDGGNGKLIVVGGANPSSSFSGSHIMNLDNHEWDMAEWDGLKSRYEHCCFVPESCPQSLWVFGGAQQTGNRNCIQNLQLADRTPHWKTIVTNGALPSPRTYHTTSACLGNRLFVFSGGEIGATPVSDSKLHIFDAVSSSWSQPKTHGRQPPPRHGHIIVAVDSKIYIHGGMAGNKFHSDMYSLDSGSMKWEKLQAKGDVPPAVAAHSAVVLGTNIYIFGGMTADGAINSMYRFNTDKYRWMLMKFKGAEPPKRLDHSMCIFPWTVCDDGTREEEDAYRPAHPEGIKLLFVFGGMDTQGTIYNDCIVTVVK